jgi:hypothetical protein
MTWRALCISAYHGVDGDGLVRRSDGQTGSAVPREGAVQRSLQEQPGVTVRIQSHGNWN